jgi:pimeloyl-ACP methyl ester carboxylesterase
MSYGERIRNAVKEKKEHTLDIIGSVTPERFYDKQFFLLIGAIETHEKIADEWFGNINGFAGAEVALIKNGTGEYHYNATDLKKAEDWFMEHSEFFYSESEDVISINFYSMKWGTHCIMATIRAGVLILNLLLALAALINLMNIISTGIANRRSELASLQCIGMTDRQLDGMAVIECLQFAGAAAVISAVICAVVIFGSELGLTAFINTSFVDESEEIRKMLTNLIRFDHITPFVRIVLAALTAFAAGCVTSLVMLRAQNSDSLSDQMRGTEMKPDTKRSHLLRNSVIAVVSAFVLVIIGLRIYSIAAYRHGRNEYAKAGYLNLVESNGFKMNVYSTGAEHGKHTIVGLAGMGVHCYPVVTQALNERLGKENTLVYPDRAGYGFSDDSYKSQTLGQVVEDYRTGLKNAGFQPPYVLMPHSYSSYYALWWQEKYPEEIEAIVFMDCTEVMENECWEKWTVDAYPSRSAAYADARRAVTRTWLGLDRLIDYYGQGTAEESTYGRSVLTQEQLDLWDLTEQRIWSTASISDMANEQDAANEVRKILRPTDIPKLYFCTTPTCEEDIRDHLEMQNADVLAAGKEPKLDPETAAKAEWQRDGWACQDYYANTLTPFLEQCGNCRLVCVGCDHGLFYAQKPQQVADEILALLAEIE